MKPFGRRARRCRKPGSDAGLSLVEAVVSMSLLGIVVVALLLAFATATTTSAQQQRQAIADALVRNAAEVVSTAATTYITCATTTSYTGLPADPAGLVALTVTKVEYWDGSGPSPAANGFSTTCTSDRGLQRITLRAASSDGKVSESFVVIKRRTT